jgi:thiol-disulfide isomerase/thioredoxin
MKKTTIYQVLRKSFAIIIILCIVLTTGCGAEKSASSDEKGKTKTEDEVQEQDQTGEDTEIVGLTSFHTKDIYGNDVNQDIFKDYKLNLVNVWGTFCGPCLDEMPYLGELQKEYEPKGVNIVGIAVDVQDEEMEVIDDQIELAKQISDSTGADYTHLIMSNDLIPVMNQFDAIPASFFVDSGGNIVSEYYIGSRSKEDWVDIIETNLEKQQ